MPLRYITGRQRRIELNGTFSFNVAASVRVDSCSAEWATDSFGFYIPGSTGGYEVDATVATGNSEVTAGCDRQFTTMVTTPVRHPLAPNIWIKQAAGAVTKPQNYDGIDPPPAVVQVIWSPGISGIAPFVLYETTVPYDPNRYNFPGETYGEIERVSVETTVSGSYSIWVDVEEVFEMAIRSTGASIDNVRDFSELAGIPNVWVRYYERLRPAGTRGITVNGRTVELHNDDTGITASLWSNPLDYYYPYFGGSVLVNGTGANVANAATWTGGVVSVGPIGGVSASSGGSSATHTSASASSAGVSSADFYNAFFPPMAYQVNGYVYAGDVTEPTTGLQFEVLAGYGVTISPALTNVSGIKTIVQKWRRSYAGANGGTGYTGHEDVETEGLSASAYDPAPIIGARLSDASIAALGLANCGVGGRMCLRGHIWPALTISQNATRNLAAAPHAPVFPPPGGTGYTINGWSAIRSFDASFPFTERITATTVALSGSVVQITTKPTSALSPVAYKESEVGALLKVQNAIEHRYLTIRVRSVGKANVPFRLRFDNSASVWNSQTGDDGAFVERTFDLLLPVLAVNQTRPRFTASVPIGGIFDTLFVDGLAADCVYEVEWIKSKRVGDSRVSVYNSLHLISDGIMRFNKALKIGESSPPISSLPPQISYTSPQAAASSWVFTIPNPARPDKPEDDGDTILYLSQSDLYDGSMEAVHLAGSGLQRGGSTVLDAIANAGIGLAPLIGGGDVPVGGGITINGHHLSEQFSAYPGFGAGLDGGTYGSNTDLWFGLQWRSAVYGTVVPRPRTPVPNVKAVRYVPVSTDPATTTLTDIGPAGTGVPTATDRYYRTGSPYLRGLSDADAVTYGPSPLSHRVFLDLPAGASAYKRKQYQTYYEGGFRSLYTLYWYAPSSILQGITEVDNGRDVLIRSDENVITAYDTSDLTSPLHTTTHPAIDKFTRAAIDTRSGSVMMVGTSTTGAWKVLRSDDFGRTASEVTSVVLGESITGAVAVFDAHRLCTVLIVSDDVGTVVSYDTSFTDDTFGDPHIVLGFPGSGNPLPPTTDAQVLGAAFEARTGDILLTVQISAGIRTYRTTDLGRTWSVAI